MENIVGWLDRQSLNMAKHDHQLRIVIYALCHPKIKKIKITMLIKKEMCYKIKFTMLIIAAVSILSISSSESSSESVRIPPYPLTTRYRSMA